MRCKSSFAGVRCSFDQDHGPLHTSSDGRVVWSDIDDKDFEDGFEVPASEGDEEEEDPDGPITNAVQFYVPVPYVRISRRPIPKKQKNCKRCRAAGIVYDPFTGFSGPCSSCQPASS